MLISTVVICNHYSYKVRSYVLFVILKPVLLFLIIRNDRFVGGTQQDSHEALRQILDALRVEEIDVSLQFNGRYNYY